MVYGGDGAMTKMEIVRPRLRWFVKQMDARLARPKNQRKADWREPRVCSLFSLAQHSLDEWNEMRDEIPLDLRITPARARRIIKEASDWANMAFMVADRARHEAARYARRRRR